MDKRVALLLLAMGCGRSADASKDGAAPVTSASTTAAAAWSVECVEDQNKQTIAGALQCVLAKNGKSADGYECEAKKIAYFRPNGNLKGCYLTAPREISGYTCKDGVDLYEEGSLKRCKLSAGKKVAADLELQSGDWVGLYKSGAVRRLELPSPRKIGGLTCKGYLNYFHENGKLKKCELAEDAVIEGKNVSALGPKKQPVSVCFDEGGKRVADCSLLTGLID